jgi:hypothetical protein
MNLSKLAKIEACTCRIYGLGCPYELMAELTPSFDRLTTGLEEGVVREKLARWFKASWASREPVSAEKGSDGVEGLSKAMRVAFEQGGSKGS